MTMWVEPINLDVLNQRGKDTLAEFLHIEFIRVEDNALVARMPVNNKTTQPFGLLHGGASVALAETIGSVASWCVVNKELFIGVGVEINASHIKSVTEGSVTAICSPIKISGKTHVWDIKIHDEKERLICVSRLTVAILRKKG